MMSEMFFSFSFSLPRFPRQPFMTKPFIITTAAVTYVSFYFMVCSQLASDILTSVLMAHGALFYMAYIHTVSSLIVTGAFFFFLMVRVILFSQKELHF